MEVAIDKQKIERMVRDTLMQFNGQSVHPGEIVLALSECVGRTIAIVEGEIVQRELVDLAIKQMSAAILARMPRITQ